MGDAATDARLREIALRATRWLDDLKGVPERYMPGDAQLAEDVLWLLALLKERDERIKQLEREATSVARSGGEPDDDPPAPRCSARRVHPLSTDYYIQCEREVGDFGPHRLEECEWADESKWALAVTSATGDVPSPLSSGSASEASRLLTEQDAERRAFEAWCEKANYASDDPGAPHEEAFFGGYRAALVARDAELAEARSYLRTATLMREAEVTQLRAALHEARPYVKWAEVERSLDVVAAREVLAHIDAALAGVVPPEQALLK